APAAREAVHILMNHPRAAAKWSVGLDAIISAGPKRRDDIWAMVGNAFAALADPTVLAAVSPSPAEGVGAAGFLRAKGDAVSARDGRIQGGDRLGRSGGSADRRRGRRGPPAGGRIAGISARSPVGVDPG